VTDLNLSLNSQLLNGITIGGAVQAGTDSPSGGVPYLTPDAVLSYCGAMLQGLDTQIESSMNQQVVANQASQAISSITADINNLSADGWQLSQSPASGTQILGAIQQQINELPPNSQGAQMLIQLRDTIADRISPGLSTILDGPNAYADYWSQVGTANVTTESDAQVLGGLKPPLPTGTNQIDPTADVKSWLTTLQGDQTTLDNDSQLQMVSIDSLVSQRQTAVGLATDLVQSMGDTTKSIVDKIGS